MEDSASRIEPTQAEDPDGVPRPTQADTIPSEVVDPGEEIWAETGAVQDEQEATIRDESALSGSISCSPANSRALLAAADTAPAASRPAGNGAASGEATSSLAPEPSPGAPPDPNAATVGRLPGPASSSFAVPSIPGYEVLGVLGRGGMGVVYKARQIRLNRVCALKMILAGAHATREAAARFVAEAEAIAQLQHPNIVQIHHIGESDGLPFFELEFVAGGSLDQRLDGIPWHPKQAAWLVEQVARGIGEAHRLGILHRDLKPSNVLLATNGTPKITDFGLAKAEGKASSLTRSDSILGSPSYMAPEQASGKTKQAGPMVDTYAIGATLYELLTGRPPFRGTTPLETMEQVRAIEPVPPSRLVPKLPRDIETICLKCLQKEPGKRYESALALAEDLRRFQAGDPILARRIGGAERVWRWCRRNPLVAALAGAVAAALILGTIVSCYFALRAHRGETLALQKATEAQAHALRATIETQRANLEAQRATESKLLSERRLYVAEMNLAQRAWREGNTQLLERHLDAYRPNQPGQTDLRGFEWHYLEQLSRMDLRTLRGHNHNVMGVAFDPEGRRLISASEDGTLKLWNAATGDEIRTLRRDAGNVFCAAFSPDGRHVASGSMDQTVTLWDVESGQALHVLRGHSGLVLGVAFSPDGHRIASASHDATLKLWDVTTGEELKTLRGHGGQLWGVTFSPDGRSIASASEDQTIGLWDAGTGERLHRLLGHSARVWGISFSPDSARLVSGSSDRTVRVWDVAAGQEIMTLPGHGNQVFGVAFSPDGRHVVSASGDSTVKLWDLTTRRELRTFGGHSAAVLSVVFSPDGRRIASASNDRSLKLWDAASPQAGVSLRGHAAPVTSVAYTPDGRRVASGGCDRWIKIWDAATLEEILTLRGHSSVVSGVAFSPDGRFIASASFDGTVKLWDAETGKNLQTLIGHSERILGLAISRDGRFVASGAVDRSVRIWDTTSAAASEVMALRGHSDKVTAVAISPDNSLIASAGTDKIVNVWETTTGHLVRTLRGHSAGVTSVAFSPDGSQLASGGDDQTVRLWEPATGRELLTLRGHSASVLGVSYSPDGHRIASSSDDASLILWDAVTGQVVLTLRAHSAAVPAAAFRPDGLQIASVSSDQSVKLWDAAPLSPELRAQREARGALEFLFAKPLATAQVVAAIRNDPSLSETVRRHALALADSYGRALVQQEAQRVVHALYDGALLQKDVLQSLRDNPSLSEPVRQQAIELAESMPEDAYRLNGASWAVARDRDAAPQAVRRALRAAQAACRIVPQSGSVLNTLGVAQYRAGDYEDAIATLTRSAQLMSEVTGHPDPADLAFMALSHDRLGRKAQALEILGRLRKLMKLPECAQNQESQDFFREAESLELDLVFPANPLAPAFP
jgi:WD40 repeat protein/tRNA A-37 threonylcarbamoyl transferase component Bud32